MFHRYFALFAVLWSIASFIHVTHSRSVCITEKRSTVGAYFSVCESGSIIRSLSRESKTLCVTVIRNLPLSTFNITLPFLNVHGQKSLLYICYTRSGGAHFPSNIEISAFPFGYDRNHKLLIEKQTFESNAGGLEEKTLYIPTRALKHVYRSKSRILYSAFTIFRCKSKCRNVLVGNSSRDFRMQRNAHTSMPYMYMKKVHRNNCWIARTSRIRAPREVLLHSSAKFREEFLNRRTKAFAIETREKSAPGAMTSTQSYLSDRLRLPQKSSYYPTNRPMSKKESLMICTYPIYRAQLLRVARGKPVRSSKLFLNARISPCKLEVLQKLKSFTQCHRHASSEDSTLRTHNRSTRYATIYPCTFFQGNREKFVSKHAQDPHFQSGVKSKSYPDGRCPHIIFTLLSLLLLLILISSVKYEPCPRELDGLIILRSKL